MSISLAIKDITLSYGQNTVLDRISHEFAPGVTALMGSNGSGKSTLMKLCALIEEPTSGSLVFKQEDNVLEHNMTLKRRITMVMPKGGIFNRSVCANAAYGLRLRGLRGEELRRLTHDALDRVGLLHKKDQRALSLSSGESQRLAIARALAINPDVLLLDEPTASVDEDNTAIIESIVLDLARMEGAPLVILATHDREQARRLASETLFLSRGKLSRRPD